MRLSKSALSKKTVDRNFLRDNKKLQYVLFGFYSFIVLAYMATFLFQLSGMLASMEYNTNVLASDTTSVAVSKFTVEKDGQVSGVLVNGKAFSVTQDDVVFVKSLPNSETGVLSDTKFVCEPNSGFATSILISSRAFIMLVLSAVMLIVIIIAKKKGYKALGTKKIYLFNCFLFVGMLSLVGTTYILMTK